MNSTARTNVDVSIGVGSVLGLWLVNDPRTPGYCSCLLESGAPGGASVRVEIRGATAAGVAGCVISALSGIRGDTTASEALRLRADEVPGCF